MRKILAQILRFLVITLVIAFTGIVLVGIGTSTKNSIGFSFLDILGFILFFISPIVSFYIVRDQFKKKKKEKEQIDIKLLEREENILKEEEQRREDLLRRKFVERQRLIDSVDRHRSALKRNLERSIKKNDYGSIIEDKSTETLEEFFASIALDLNVIDKSEAAELVNEQLNIREEEEKSFGFDPNNLPNDGHAFERWVAESLMHFGWSAEITSASGDQGIDVIAEYQGKRIGLQCKLYNSPIGNKAVQEAHAGRLYYGLDIVGVISNELYTSSAKDLATVTGILLLSHHDIPKIHEIISEF